MNLSLPEDTIYINADFRKRYIEENYIFEGDRLVCQTRLRIINDDGSFEFTEWEINCICSFGF